MNKREKIIIIITVGVALYALLDFLVLSKSGKEEDTARLARESKQNAADFSARTLARITAIEIQAKKNRDNQLISKIESPWPADPFIRIEKKKQPAAKTKPVAAGITYTGFMKLGVNSFAIINGMEYKVGEMVQDTGFKVAAILPKKVVLKKGDDKAVIYLEEE